MKYLIIGGGVAAFEGAIAVRQADKEAPIAMFSDEAVLPYRRPALSRMPKDELSDVQFYLKDEKFFRDNRIEIMLNAPGLSINRKKRSVTLAGGREERYDKLLIAAGGRSFCPPIHGLTRSDKIFSLRNYADLMELKTKIKSGIKKVAILGGGLLALELAETLLELGLETAVMELCPDLLPRQLDKESAAIVSSKLAEVKNLSLHFGVEVQKVTSGSRLEIELGEKQPIIADLLLVSAGVCPNLELACACNLAADKHGICVDKFMQTSDQDIFAAGDCASFNGCNWGLFTPAKNMGNIAGTNMAAKDEASMNPFIPEVYPARLNAFGFKLFSAGTISGDDCKTEIDGGKYSKIFYCKGKAVGGIVLNDMAKSLEIQNLISAAAK